MPYRMIRACYLSHSLAAGTVTWDEVDTAVARVVATRRRFEPVLDAAGTGPRGAGLRRTSRRWRGRRRRPPWSCCATSRSTVHRSFPLSLPPSGSVAVLGPLATAVDLGDGGSSDVWAPDVVTPTDGMRAALGDAAVRVGGSDPIAAAELAAAADAAMVVVGYTARTRVSSSGPPRSTPSPRSSRERTIPNWPNASAEEVATERRIEPPAHVAARSDEQPFDIGGDRASLRLHDEDVALVRAVAAVNPRTAVVLVAGSAVVDLRMGPLGPRDRAGVVLGHGRGARARRRALRPGRRRRAGCPSPSRCDEADLPDFDARGHRVHLRRLARLLVPRARGHGAGLSVRVRPQLHLVRAA